MADENPYQTRQARVEDALADDRGIEDVRKGQRLVIFAVVLNVLAMSFGIPGSISSLWWC